MTKFAQPAYLTDWLTTIRRYLVASALGHLGWEIAQLPLYTLWQSGTAGEITVAVLHCALGDMLIAIGTLVVALVMVGAPGWPVQRLAAVGAVAVILGVSYTVYSEYVNTVIRQNWSYALIMPTLPWLGTGFSPLGQWLIVPTLALAWGGRTVQSGPRSQ